MYHNLIGHRLQSKLHCKTGVKFCRPAPIENLTGSVLTQEHLSYSVPWSNNPGGGGILGSIVTGYVPLASQTCYPIIVSFVANYRLHLSHFWVNMHVTARPSFVDKMFRDLSPSVLNFYSRLKFKTFFYFKLRIKTCQRL